ncbi:MAG: hypothetical protein WBG46_10260 [Nonlabens sp.]
MKYWVEYLFIALGAVCSLISIYLLFDNENYFQDITGIIVGIGLIKAMADKIKSSKEKKIN